jgi:hypothetical protein
MDDIFERMVVTEPITPVFTPSPTKNESRKPWLKLHRQLLTRFFIGIALITAISVAGMFLYSSPQAPQPLPSDPVPLRLRQAVNFSVYYPAPSKLPVGYRLDTSSFTGSAQAIVYVVRYSNQKLTFTVQQKPSESDIQDFYHTHLPLHTTVSTRLGEAAIGAIGSQTVVSLPTKSSAWLLVTGPPNVDKGELTQILESLIPAV